MERLGRTLAGGFLRALRRLLRDTAGNVAVMLALSLVPLSLAAVGAVDVSRVVSAKSRLQDALDAAALAAARDSVRDPTRLQQYGAEAFAQNLQDARALTVVGGPTFQLTDDRVVVADAAARVDDTIVAALLLGGSFTVNAHAEVRSSGANVEVSLVLDITGSMNDPVPNCARKIDCLKTAASSLVDIVIRDDQTPFYSKMALIPYAAAVNVSPYQNAVRGPVAAGTCSTPGCARFSFTAENGQPTTYDVSNCATERLGVHAYTDAPVTTAYVGRHYGPLGACRDAGLTPLTTDRAYLKGRIAGFDTGGSTAGHIGLAWGWYLVSPTFMAPWQDAASKPGAYDTDKLLKVVVLMSDGLFNTVYCRGVVARNSLGGSGGSSTHINCDSENGLPYAQATALCNAIKAKGVIIYTVLFDEQSAEAKAFMESCATDRAKVYLATNGVQLNDAFAAIGADITKLRLSR